MGYTALADFRGKLAPHVLGIDQVDREHDCYAAIDPERCTACGTCLRVCIYGAVSANDEYAIDREACDGCGLCEQLCPAQCIEMKPLN
jgi:MinD superfamily P-loop ATPase